MRTDRGTITEIKMHIVYPDGREKDAVFNSEWIEGTGAILIHEDCMTPEQAAQFNRSENWETSPTFLRWEKLNHTQRDKDCLGGGTCTDCCDCTSCPK